MRFFQSNHEGAYVEEIHRAPDYADALILNPGAWTHYAWAIRDAVEIAGLPAYEVHLSDVDGARGVPQGLRDPRRLRRRRCGGRAPEGYRDALAGLRGRAGVTTRADRVEARLDGVDALLVTDLVNLRYLTGFTGTNGLCRARARACGAS